MKVDDFVVINKHVNDIEKNAVGIIKEIEGAFFTVFFIGKQIELKLTKGEISFLDISKTGKPYKYKICNVCHVLKEDFVDFDINQTDAKGRKTTRPTCKSCRVKIDGVPIAPAEKEKLDARKPEKFFICPICKKASIPGVTANLVRDHDHHTGKARDWICDSCNTGLGRFKDDIALLERAIEYLKKYSE